jgi:hypothetical protein
MASPHGDVPKGCELRVPSGRHFTQLGKDQITDYAPRHKMPLAEVEKWLGPYLDYDSGT